MKPMWMHILKIVWFALLWVGGAWVVLRWFEWRQCFHPRRPLATTPDMEGLPFEDVEFMAEDGTRLHGWWIPHETAPGTILYFHGNAGNVGDLMAWAVAVRRFGLNLFVFDYRGYGRSGGFPTEKGLYRDARAAYEVVRARHGNDEKPPVILWGHSLGAAVAVHLAGERAVRGLIVEGAFDSLVRIGELYFPGWPVRHLVSFRFESVAKIGSIHIPKLCMHAPADEVVAYTLGRRLYAAAAEPKQWLDIDGGHNDSGWAYNPAQIEVLRRWVQDVIRKEG